MIDDSAEIAAYRRQFYSFYETNLKHLFAELEKTRKKYLKIFWLSAFGVFGLLPMTVFWQLDNIMQYVDSSQLENLFFVYFLLAGVIAIPIKMYENKNKNIIMPEFIKFFQGFTYSPSASISKKEVSKSLLFGIYDDKSGDDYFKGSYKGVDVVISEEKLEKYYYDSKGKRRERTIFEGILVSLEMNKNFEGQTVGKRDKGFLNKFNGCTGLENVKLEDVVFEKEWEIYSNNQVEARYLLTTAFMERLLRVKKMYLSNRLQFSFFDNVLFLAIDSGENMFQSSSLFLSTFDRKHINKTLEQFLSVLAIVDLLKLDVRLGL